MSLIYVATRLVQAPFALTVAVAFSSSLLSAGILVAILLIITRLLCSPVYPQPEVREMKHFERATYVKDFAIRV
jgi:hypothetical protein